MTITYDFETGKQYEVCGNPECETESFEYDVGDTSKVVEQCFMNEFGTTLIQTREIIDEFNLWEELEERYEDEIKEYFRDEACEAYADSKEYESDPYSYYGVSIHDFI